MIEEMTMDNAEVFARILANQTRIEEKLDRTLRFQDDLRTLLVAWVTGGKVKALGIALRLAGGGR